MGIFSRFTDIMNANLNALMDKAEDPEKMARLMIQEMEETLVEVRSSAVKSIADKKEIERRLEELKTGQKEWAEKAEFAIGKGREDLAKGALVAKRKLADQADALESELVHVEAALTKYNDDMAKLQVKLEEARAKRKSIEIRMKSAQKRVQIRRTLNDGRIDEAFSRYENLERRIDELEADADSYDLGKDGNGPRSLEQELDDLAAENGVEEELEALKKKVGSKKK